MAWHVYLLRHEVSMTINTTQLKAFGLFSMTGATGLVIMGAFDSATKFVNTLPRETVIRLTDTLPVMTLALCGFTFAGGVLIAWAFSIARMRPMSASTSSASVGQQQLAPQIEIRKPLQLQLPPAQPPAPSFASWRGDIATSAQREATRATSNAYNDNSDTGDDYTQYDVNTPQFADYGPNTGNFSTPTSSANDANIAQNVPNDRITVRLSDGKQVTVSRGAWLAFAQLERISRDQWRQQLRAMNASAPNEDFSTCRQIASAYNLLNGGNGWMSAALRNRVTQWIIE